MTTVQFGSDAFIELVSREDCDYGAVYPIVDAVIRPFVRQKARDNPEIWDDLLQDIHLTVWQHLPGFLERAEAYTPQQRLGWLYTTASNKITNAFRAMSHPTERCAELDETLRDPSGSPETQLLLKTHNNELSLHVDGLLHKACSMRSKPESTLAFLYNRVVLPLETEHNRKGDNKAVQMRLNGQPLGKIREQLEYDLSHALGREISPDILAPLDRNLQGREADLFLLSTRQIATASYSVVNALSARQERDIDEAAHGLTKNSFSLIIHGLLHYIGQQDLQRRDGTP